MLKDTFTEFNTLGVQEVIVLPSDLRRAKQLTEGSEIQVGCAVDFPLAQGTIAKKALRSVIPLWMALIFRSLATSGFVGGKERTADLAELMETSRSLALSGGEIRWAVNTSLMNELTKIQVAQRLKAWDWPSITLGQQLTVSDALHDVSIFALDGVTATDDPSQHGSVCYGSEITCRTLQAGGKNRRALYRVSVTVE